jgi:hypothetical protein
MKSVDFDEKSLRFASRTLSMGKHPRRLSSGALRGKNRGFRTLITTLEFRYRKRAAVLKTVARKEGYIQVICYSSALKTVDITGFFKKFCITIRNHIKRM